VSTHRIDLTVNGTACRLEVDADRFLVDVLRDDLGLTGTKEGCSIGVCGLCSVLVDGKLMSACLLYAVSIDGASITTVEGLADPDGQLSPLQEAFIRRGGFQCGICTPGQLVAATALLAEGPRSTAEIRQWMAGNLCRCTGYQGIIEAVATVAGIDPGADG
jgi:aerobic-type carbon monoxide dehydrogenase small subunit (CoxS/CutS family)